MNIGEVDLAFDSLDCARYDRDSDWDRYVWRLKLNYIRYQILDYTVLLVV